MSGSRRGRGGGWRGWRGLAVAVVTALVVLASGRHWTRPAGAAPVLRVVASADADALWTPDQPLFVLLLGDDSRPVEGCGCSDAIHLVGIPPGGGRATMINIPRDTRVAIPGRGMGKLNEALRDGPEASAAAVSGFVGAPVAYTVVVGFHAFPALVDDLGGVTVDIPTRIYDRGAGSDLRPGPVVLGGDAALAFARARHVPGGDFTRTGHQGLFIISALGQLRTNGVTPRDEIGYLGTLLRHADVRGISAAELYRLGRVALAIDPNAVRSVTMPGYVADIGRTSYVLPGRGVRGLFADFADDAILQNH